VGLVTTTLPMVPEEITAAWLSSALGQEVARLEVTEIVWGTATKVRMSVELADGDDGPVALCAKGGFDERLRGYQTGPAYVLEARFFGELAPRLELPLPRSWYAGIEPERHQGIVILDDLVARGCSFGEPTEPWSTDLVAAGLDVLARLHAQTSTADAVAGLDWLRIGSMVRDVAGVLLSEPHWSSHFAQEGAPVLPVSLQDPQRITAAFERLWEFEDASRHCVTHGDAHVGNTYLEPSGQPVFIDWQTLCLGPWSYDVAYFIGGALSVADRRAAERDLLLGYLQALRGAGGPAVDPDEAWQAYVRHTLHGFLWAVTPAVMQPLERVVAMAERYAAAIEDLDVLRVLES
jgi:Phosphotransferase enzyme family